MTGTIKRLTNNFQLGIPYFNSPNWGAIFERNMNIIDAVLSTAGVVTSIVGPWETNTAYGVDDRVVDTTDQTVWQCAVAHTSGGGTMADDRTANPTYWDPVNTSIVVRDEFTTGTDYFVGDFVFSSGELLSGIVLSPFTGGATLRDNIANLGVTADFGGNDFDSRLDALEANNPRSIATGGTGATTAADARTNLDVPGLSVQNIFTANQVLSTSDDGTTGPILFFQHQSPTPAVNDLIAQIRFNGKDSGGTDTIYGRIIGQILDPTDGAEASQILFQAAAAGVATTRLSLSGTYAAFTVPISISGHSEALAIRSANSGTGPAFIRFEDSGGVDIAAIGLGSSDTDLDIVAYNSGAINLNGGTVTAIGPIRASSGASNNPGYGFTDNPDTGMFYNGTDIAFTVNSSVKMNIDSDSVNMINGARLSISSGSVTAPAIYFADEPDDDTGIWRISEDTLGIACNGLLSAYFNSAGITAATTTASATFGSVAAAKVLNAGLLDVTRNGGTAARLSRMTSDGQVISYHRDASNVGGHSVTAAGTTFNNTSDGRLKVNRAPIENDLDLDLIYDTLDALGYDMLSVGTQEFVDRMYGYIAQDVYNIPGLQQFVTPGVGEPGDEDYVPWMLDYTGLHTVIIASIKHRQKKLEARIAALEAK